MDRIGFLLCVAAAVCVSAQQALLLSALIALTLLFTAVLRMVLSWWGAPLHRGMSLLFAAAVGGSLQLLFLAFLPAADALQNGLYVLPLVLLCGLVDTDELPTGILFKYSGVLLLIGSVRELLSTGSWFGYPLPITAAGDSFGMTAAHTVGVGGVLVAAGLLWVTGVSHPLRPPARFRLGGAIRLGLLTAAVVLLDGVLRWLWPDLSDVWRVWVATAVTAIPLLLGETAFPGSAAVIPPIAVLLVGDLSPLMAVIAGGIVGVGYTFAWAVADRMGRAPLPRRFSGPPALLTAATVVLAALTAL